MADLSRVWVVLKAYEQDLPWIEEGAEVGFQTKAHPGREFKGIVTYVDPVVDPATRTVDVRLEVSNTNRLLKPGMFVQAEHRPVQEQAGQDGQLVIPASAPLLTGKRAVVYVAVPDHEGTFEGREVVLAPRTGDFYVVRSGLTEGEMVVTRGNFKIDSALQIMARPSMMTPGDAPAPSAHAGHNHAMSKENTGAMEQPAAAFEIPELFASRLHLMAARAEKVSENVRAKRFEESRASFAAFGRFLSSMDGATLTGDAALHWKEVSMLLTNDAVLGAEAPNMKRMTQVESEFRAHFDRLARTFPIHAGMPGTQKAPVKFQAQLGAVYLHYSAIMEAFAADDFPAVREALSGLKAAVDGVDMALLNETQHHLWMEKLAMIRKGMDQMSQAEDIVSGRVGFEPLSIGLTEAIMGLGIIVDGPLYEMTCPMAFENKGAAWLQQDPELRNPYFGEAMYRCGEMKRQLKEE